MTQNIRAFPALEKAALLIAYDNGIIHRDCSRGQFLESLDPIIGADGVDYQDIYKMNLFLSNLTDKEMEDLCQGEETDSRAISSRYESPEMLEGLLETIFNDGGV